MDTDRRRFVSMTATSIAAAQIGILGAADAQASRPRPADVPPIKPGTHTSLGPLKQIDDTRRAAAGFPG